MSLLLRAKRIGRISSLPAQSESTPAAMMRIGRLVRAAHVPVRTANALANGTAVRGFSSSTPGTGMHASSVCCWSLSRHSALMLVVDAFVAHVRLCVCDVSFSYIELEWMKNKDPYCNVGDAIAAKIGVNLHRQKNHPLNIIKTKIEGYFDDLHENHGYVCDTFDTLLRCVPVI